MVIQSLDDIFPAEFVAERKRIYELQEVEKKSDQYWDMLGELMFYGGFDAVRAVLDDYLTLEQAIELLYSTRKVYNMNIIDIGQASMAGARSVYKGSEFKRIMSEYYKGTK